MTDKLALRRRTRHGQSFAWDGNTITHEPVLFSLMLHSERVSLYRRRALEDKRAATVAQVDVADLDFLDSCSVQPVDGCWDEQRALQALGYPSGITIDLVGRGTARAGVSIRICVSSATVTAVEKIKAEGGEVILPPNGKPRAAKRPREGADLEAEREQVRERKNKVGAEAASQYLPQ